MLALLPVCQRLVLTAFAVGSPISLSKHEESRAEVQVNKQKCGCLGFYALDCEFGGTSCVQFLPLCLPCNGGLQPGSVNPFFPQWRFLRLLDSSSENETRTDGKKSNCYVCLSLLSVAVIHNLIESNLEKKGFFILHVTFHHQGQRGWGSGQEPGGRN